MSQQADMTTTVQDRLPHSDRGLLMAAVTILTASMLTFEILQTVTLSLQIFEHNAFLVVCLSMLGLGCGGSLANWLWTGRDSWLTSNPIRALWLSSLGFGVSLIVSIGIASRLSNLYLISLALVPPYAFVGLFLAVLFAHWAKWSHRSYFFDLIGSGLGCVIVVVLLERIGDAPLIFFLLALGGLASSLCLAVVARRRSWFQVSAAGVLAIGLLIPWANESFPFRPNDSKHYGIMLADPSIETQEDWSRWGYLGRLDSVVPEAGAQKFMFGELAHEALAAGCDFRYLFANGDNWSYLIDFRGNDDYREALAHRMIPAAPYVLLDAPRVLNIGIGGGVDIFLAVEHGASSITGVEINPLMLEAVTVRHPEFWDGPWKHPSLEIHELDGRTFVNSTEETFDLITLTAVDTGAGLAAGAAVLSENYLYTQEAFDRYFDRLSPNGVLFILRPWEQNLRSIVTAVESLRKLGIEHPEQHAVVLGGKVWDQDWLGSVISKSPISREAISTFQARLQADDFNGGAQYLPGVSGLQSNVFLDFFAAVSRGEEREFINSLHLDLTPVTDDRPYYYQTERSFLGSTAARLLISILTLVASTAIVLILLPLLRAKIPVTPSRSVSILGYFAGIGLAFMLVEISLIQKLALFLGHPAYSVSVSLFSMLVFSGLGSLAVGRRPAASTHRLTGIFIAICLTILGYAFGLGTILSAARLESLGARALLTVILLAPGSFLMGMPFPEKIHSLRGELAATIPWAWGVNAYASVTASVLAVILAMNIGFRAVLMLGAVFYLVAAAFHLLFDR